MQIYQKIWKAIRDNKDAAFTITDIQNAAGIAKRQSARDHVLRFFKAGYLEVVEGSKGGRGCAKHYKLLKDEHIAPKLRPDGTSFSNADRVNNYMWRSMKMLKQFTPKDLSVHASTKDVSVTLQHAQRYCALLLNAGYLANKPRSKATYIFLSNMNTGYQAPIIKRVSAVFDQNTGSVIWADMGRVA